MLHSVNFVCCLLLCLPLSAQAHPELPITPHGQLTTEAGKEIKFSDFAGKPLIIHFWATWCPCCKKLQSGLDSLINLSGRRLAINGA
ncbi:MAG: cytochrome c biogenesis protein CcmG/thiol:disulfide interchange protein DsbE [Paraglaciecola sp.]|jgi:cytochrome c biogenesis protein CcmG/thiol:disulfide interchange protein DsbE